MSARRTSPAARDSASRPSGGRRPALLAATAALAALAVAGAVVALGDGPDHHAPAAAPAGAAGEAAGMAHVHGLGIDDGLLVAGTHSGAFRIAADGTATQVGPDQDFMGFTVVGPGHYLASGHPGPGQDAPAALGLIESTDGGTTWDSVSLQGRADFHSLEARHGRVYGHSGGVLMVSDDTTTWDERAAIALADLAVSPDDPDTVLATTEQGVAVSTDGGDRFELVDGAPTLLLVDWTDGGTVVGVDPRGTVHVSEDDAASWSRRGAVDGPPAAVTAEGEAVFVATVDGRVLESRDGGRTFDVRYRAG